MLNTVEVFVFFICRGVNFPSLKTLPVLHLLDVNFKDDFSGVV